MSYQDDLQKLLISTPNLQEIFTILRNNSLQEAYLCAGWVRNLVWNNLNQLEPTYLQDNLDIYYKKNSETAEEHQILTTKLNTHHAKYLWDLHNLASPRPHYSKIPQGDSIQEILTKFLKPAVQLESVFKLTDSLKFWRLTVWLTFLN